jgi:hypothetical protein
MKIDSDPQYKMGQTLRIIVDGRPQLTGTVIDRLTSRVQKCGDHLYHFYAMAIPSACLPGQVNLMWCPEHVVATPEECDDAAPRGADARPYFPPHPDKMARRWGVGSAPHRAHLEAERQATLPW